MKRFKIHFLSYTPDFGSVSSYIFINAKSQKDAETQLTEKGYHIVLTEEVGNYKEWILDLWYEMYPMQYMECWEPNISSAEILLKWKKTFPYSYQIIVKGGLQ